MYKNIITYNPTIWSKYNLLKNPQYLKMELDHTAILTECDTKVNILEVDIIMCKYE
jgi:hypothetical protein